MIVAEVLVNLTDYRGGFRGVGIFVCEAAGPLVPLRERTVIRLGRVVSGAIEIPRSSTIARSGSATDQAWAGHPRG